jgi:hypothetical protein
MTQKQKYLAIGGIMLAIIGFLGYKAFAKKGSSPLLPSPEPPAPAPKKKGSVFVGEPTGGFELPAEVFTRVGTRLRSDSTTSSSIIYTYPSAGTKLLVKGAQEQSDGDWFNVFDSKGRSGWVRSDVVDIPTVAAAEFNYDESIFDEYFGV